jgi:hypothetical protein
MDVEREWLEMMIGGVIAALDYSNVVETQTVKKLRPDEHYLSYPWKHGSAAREQERWHTALGNWWGDHGVPMFRCLTPELA